MRNGNTIGCNVPVYFQVRSLEVVSRTRKYNKPFHLLIDGVVSAFTARLTADETHGYHHNAVHAGNKMLAGNKDNSAGLNIHVTTVLPVCELNTSHLKQLAFVNGTRFMNVSSMIFLNKNPEETSVDIFDACAKQLVSEFNKNCPKLNLIYCGYAVTNSRTCRLRLD